MKAMVVLGGVGAVAASAIAGGYYGGDPDKVGGISNSEKGFPEHARVYVDFDWPGGRVTSLFSNNMDLGGGTAAGYLWEIRSAAAPGDGGAVVASSSTHAGKASYTFTGWYSQGKPINQLLVDVDDFSLDAGQYHLAVVPGDGMTYLATTDGAMSVGGPINNWNDLLDSPASGFDFTEIRDFAPPSYRGFSIGIVPSPGAGAMLVGLVAVVRRRR